MSGVARWVRENVFPTPVGVFPHDLRDARQRRSLPHTRGGVSTLILHPVGAVGSSPHPWGCFSTRYSRTNAVCVFPTPVGVFP